MTESKNPFLQNNFAPVRFEGTCYPLRAEGKIPVIGTLLRNGTNPQFEPVGSYHWFGGDGMIHAVSWNGKEAWTRNRWVRTPRFELERSLGFNALSNFIDPSRISPLAASALSGIPDELKPGALFSMSADVANTHVIPWGNEILALAEGNMPYRLDAENLETLSKAPIPGFETFTAHAKVHQRTGRLIGNASSAEGTVAIAAYNNMAKPEVLGEIQTPAPAMLHDMCVTENFAVLPWFPAVFGRPGSGDESISWKPEMGVRVALAPLRPGFDSKDVRWFEAPLCHSYHIANAFEREDAVVLDLVCRPSLGLFGDAPGHDSAYLARWIMNLSKGTLTEEILYRGNIEFPRIDEARVGLSYEACYLALNSKGGLTFDTVLRLEPETGKRHEARFEGEISEPVHSRDQNGCQAVIVTEYLPRKQTTSVRYLDPVSLDLLGSVHLETRIPHGFHGSFVSDRVVVR